MIFLSDPFLLNISYLTLPIMKTKMFLLFLCLYQTFISAAQTTITLGTGTNVSNTQGPIYIAKGTAPRYSRHGAFYTKAEINTSGVNSGVIQKIRWYKGDINSYTQNNGQMQIYMKHNTQAAFSNSTVTWATEVAGATLVYNSNTQNFPASIGWQEFILTSPFVWNGTDNLQILVEWMQPSTSTVNLGWQYTPNMIDMAANGSNTTPSSIFFSASGWRPNIQLEFGSNTVTDAGITAITAPVSPVLPGVSQPVQVTLRNFGGTGLTAATINWSVNGVLQPPYSWSGTLAPATSSTSLTIGNFTFPAGSHSVCAWTQNPNGTSDSNTQNDSSCVTLASCAPLRGNYTINSGSAASATNFISFTAATQRLNDCGLAGPVKFTVAPGSGPYAGQFEIGAIPGSQSATDSVVFECNNVTFNALNSAANLAAIRLNGARKVTFRNLNLNLSNSSQLYSYGFQLLNGADSCTIANCAITFTSNNLAYGILAGSTPSATGNFTSYSTFRNNTITGTHTGIRLNGGATSPATGNRILNNQVMDFDFNGIYLNHALGALIQGNEISRPTTTGGLGFKGIYLDQSYGRNVINANRLHRTHVANLQSQAFGIQLENTDAPAGAENLITNNLLYNFNNTGDKVALYNLSSDGAHYFHNTVFLENTQPASGNTRAFYQDGAATNIKFINNIISLGMAGGYKHHALYFNTSASTIESHHNGLYLNPAATAPMFTGYAGSIDYPTLANWQLAPSGPYDQNSSALNPAFANVATGNFKPTNNALKNIGAPLAAVTKDFAGTPRSVTNPDPGAFEFSNPLGTKEAYPNAFALIVYPNPNKGAFQVKLPTTAKPANLTLTTITGQTVKLRQLKQSNGNIQVETTGLTPGIYFLKVASEVNIQVVKVMIQ